MIRFKFPPDGLPAAPAWLRKMAATHWMNHTLMEAGIMVFSTDPVILVVKDWFLNGHQLAELVPFREWLAGERAQFFILPAWDITTPALRQRIVKRHKADALRYPLHRTIRCAPDAEVEEMLKSEGIETIRLSHNAFLDENVYRPLPEEGREWDAIYDAQVVPFKRHDLAAEIRSLCLIAYIAGSRDTEYMEFVHRILPQAHWANDPLTPGHRRLMDGEVNAFLNRARVGLCLSGTEGAMYASCQYLLAGIPVVSTPSRGGREEFFHPDFVRIVEPGACAVADGVREMAAMRLDPHAIREVTLRRITEHRANFRAAAERFASECGRPFDFDELWRRNFVNHVTNGTAPLREILRKLQAK